MRAVCYSDPACLTAPGSHLASPFFSSLSVRREDHGELGAVRVDVTGIGVLIGRAAQPKEFGHDPARPALSVVIGADAAKDQPCANRIGVVEAADTRWRLSPVHPVGISR